MSSFPFHVRHPNEGQDGMKDKDVPYKMRFENREKYLYVSRIAFIKSWSVNETIDRLMFGKDWQKKNEFYKRRQKALGVTDAQMERLRSRRIRYWKPRKKVA